MRIVTWPEFSRMPQGTVFQILPEGSCELGDVQVLHEVWRFNDTDEGGGDFLAVNLLPKCVPGCLLGAEQLATFTADEQRRGEFVMHPDLACRDGMFEYDRLWVIWEREDLERLSSWLLDPAAAVRSRMWTGEGALIAVPERP